MQYLDIHLLVTLATAGAIALADYGEAAAVVVLFAVAEHWERCSSDKVCWSFGGRTMHCRRRSCWLWGGLRAAMAACRLQNLPWQAGATVSSMHRHAGFLAGTRRCDRCAHAAPRVW